MTTYYLPSKYLGNKGAGNFFRAALAIFAPLEQIMYSAPPVSIFVARAKIMYSAPPLMMRGPMAQIMFPAHPL